MSYKYIYYIVLFGILLIEAGCQTKSDNQYNYSNTFQSPPILINGGDVIVFEDF